MSDLKKYKTKRKANDAEFAQDFDSGDDPFKIGGLLKQARGEDGITQEELATRLNTKKTTGGAFCILPKATRSATGACDSNDAKQNGTR